MSKNTGSAPAWLFSFLDLAFLILMAVLVTIDQSDEPVLDLATIELPEIDESSTAILHGAAITWRVRVHPRNTANDSAIFALVSDDPQEHDVDLRIDASQLRVELAALSERSDAKPFLEPNRDSRSEDFLIALAAVQGVWPDAQLAAVKPVAATPSVGAGPLGVDRR